jgi:hypothetical protein
MKTKGLAIVFCFLILAACALSAPSADAISTAIAQTQAANPQDTNTPVSTLTAKPEATATTVSTILVDAKPSNYIGGNEFPSLPDGEAGALSVIVVGKYDGVVLPVVVRNNTSDNVIRIHVSTVARSADGSMLAAGGDQGFKPNYVKPGEIALGYIYFDFDTTLPDDATYEFEVTAQDPETTTFENIRDLDVIEQNQVENRIVGMLKNSYNIVVRGPVEVVVYCFDLEGALLGYHSDFTDKDTAEPGETIPFQVELLNGKCPIFLVAGYGFE